MAVRATTARRILALTLVLTALVDGLLAPASSAQSPLVAPAEVVHVRLDPVAGDWRGAVDLTRLPDGGAAVVLRDAHRIVLVSPDGRQTRTLGRYGRRPGEFSSPGSIDLSRSGRAVVADPGNARIQLFDSRWIPLAQWTLAADPSSLSGAIGTSGTPPLADQAVWGENGEILAFDSRAVRLIRLSAGGGVLADSPLFGEIPPDLTGLTRVGTRLLLFDPSRHMVHLLDLDAAILGFRPCPSDATAFQAATDGLLCASPGRWEFADYSGNALWRAHLYAPSLREASGRADAAPVALDIELRDRSGWLLTSEGLYRAVPLEQAPGGGDAGDAGDAGKRRTP